MTQLVPVGLDLDSPGVVARLSEITEYVKTASGEEAASTASRARLAREYARIHKAAKEIRRAALRLEIYALRRLGEIGAFKGLSPEETNAAKEFAALDEPALERALSKWHGDSAVGFKRELVRQHETNGALRRMREWREGRDPNLQPSTDTVFALTDFRQAVAVIINNLDFSGPFEIEAVADAVLEEIDPVGDSFFDITRHAVRGFVRDALNAAVAACPDDSIDDATQMGNAPRVVTFHSDEVGWIRIPFALATVSQFEWFVQYREAQAQALEEKAAQFRSVLAAMQSISNEVTSDLCGAYFNQGKFRGDSDLHRNPDRRPHRRAS
jgi:hypothetical protein